MKRLCLLLSFAALLVGVTSVQGAGAQPAPSPQRLEGEAFSCDPASVCGSLDAAGASGGKVLRISGNGTATETFTTIGGPTSLSLRMLAKRGSGGSPRLAVKLDGAIVKDVRRYNTSGDYRTFNIPLSGVAPGAHTLELVGSNMDAGGGTRFINVDNVGVSDSVFSDGFERDADSFVPPWKYAIRCDPTDLTTSTEVARTGSHSAKFTVANNDNDTDRPLDCADGTKNPRAQIHTDKFFTEGTESWIGTSIYVPGDFPLIQNSPNDGWAILGSQGSGENANNVSTNGAPIDYFIDSFGGVNHLVVANKVYNPATRRDDIYVIWKTPLLVDRWFDLAFHEYFSKDGTKGFVEIYYNGQAQTLSKGGFSGTRLHTETLKSDQTGAGSLNRTFYHAAGMPGFEGDVSVYQDAVKTGDSLASVAP